MATCPVCHGNKTVDCKDCEGTGKIGTGGGCTHCSGTGKKACDHCKGTGQT
jgi:hypothetical protein